MCFKKKESLKPEMLKVLSDLMFEYIEENPGDEDEIIPLFDGAKGIIKQLPDKEIRKALSMPNVNLEVGVWNIAQNYAMSQIKPQSMTDFILSSDTPKELYLWINEKKYNKGYISNAQRNENAELAEKLSIKPPLGRW